MKKTEEDQLEADTRLINSEFRKSPSKKQWRIIEDICKGIRHSRIRNFMVVDGTKFKGGSIQSVIFHVAGGLWKGFNIPYNDIIEILKAHPEKDEELIMTIYSL